MSEFHSRARAIACVLALITPLRLAGAQGSRPPEPDTASPRTVALAPTAYRRPLAAAPVPYLVSDGRFTVMLAGAPTATMLDSVATRTLAPDCAERSAAGDLPPGGGSESVAQGGQLLVVIVTGAQKGTSPCQIEWNLNPLSIWRGAVLPASDGTVARAPLAARLIVDGKVVEPIVAYRRPSYQRAGGAWRREGTQLRYYYDMSVVRPREDGRSHEIALQIWDREPAPTLVDVERAAAERLAMEHVEWTLSTQSGGERAAQLTLVSARPLVPAVARILDTARSDLVAAGIQAAAWASSTRDSSSASSVVARLVAAEALLARREPVLARGIVANVQRTRPCLAPPSGSSAELSRLVVATRSVLARCEPVSPGRAATLSIVPGLGNLAVGDRGTAAIGAGLVAATLVRALMVNAQVKQRYSEYLATRDRTNATFLYDRVNELRGQRNLTLGVAAGFWLADALLAVRGAQSHGERVAHDRF